MACHLRIDKEPRQPVCWDSTFDPPLALFRLSVCLVFSFSPYGSHRLLRVLSPGMAHLAIGGGDFDGGSIWPDL